MRQHPGGYKLPHPLARFGVSVLAWILLGAVPVRTWADPGKKTVPPDSTSAKAPGFASPEDLRTLIDQAGQPFSFARSGGKTALVNFIFTSCPVKCPAQTQALVGVQRGLPPALRSRVRFVSVTVDPDRDSVPVLKRYAMSMGADLSGWSFVTGQAPELDWLYRYYSVGVTALDEGQFDHELGVYLLDARGRVMQRYTGNIDKARLVREIAEVDALGK